MVDVIPADMTTGAVVHPFEPVWGPIETNGDVDWYKKTLTAGTHYHINLLSDPVFGNALTYPRFDI